MELAQGLADCGRKQLPSGAVNATLDAVRDLAQAYQALRRDHLAECRCRQELEAEWSADRRGLLDVAAEIESDLHLLRRRLMPPMAAADRLASVTKLRAVPQLDELPELRQRR